MRLYKPCLHLSSTIPPLITQLDNSSLLLSSSSSNNRINGSNGSDFSISPFLLLPDSFGDIYTSEKFSAYIAVVNGIQDSAFHQVSLAVRLQTANATFDLYDCRPSEGITSGQSKILNPNENIDMVVQHTLTELGIHTLRVSVQYISNRSNEPKTLTKFYRFNVLQPINILSNANELNDKIMIQTKLTNLTKSPLYIDEATLIPTSNNINVVEIAAPISNKIYEISINMDSWPMLLSGESYAYSYIVPKLNNSINIGYIEVKWYSYMGEYGITKGDEITLSGHKLSNSTFSKIDNIEITGIKIECLSCPTSAIIGKEFEISIRVINNTKEPVILQLRGKDSYIPTSQEKDNNINSSNSKRRSRTESNNLTNTTMDMIGQSIFITGLTCTSLGVVCSGDYVDTNIKLIAFENGIQELNDVIIVDTNTLKEFSFPSLIKIYVHDS